MYTENYKMLLMEIKDTNINKWKDPTFRDRKTSYCQDYLKQATDSKQPL